MVGHIDPGVTFPGYAFPFHDCLNRQRDARQAMTDIPDRHQQETDERHSLLGLVAAALAVGVITGCIGAIFRLALVRADHLRDVLVAWAQGHAIAGFLIVVGVCAFATAMAAWVVRRFSPHASGSGIPHVEAVLREEIQSAPFSLLPVKFFGGLLAIGSGLALGREGPTVQMGASIAVFAARAWRLSAADMRVLLAAGAGAGLATAFNAPIAGMIFVFEELVHRFNRRIAIATFATLTTAIPVARLFLGDVPDFQVRMLNTPGAGTMPLFFIMGAVAGLLGVVYNRALLAALAAGDRLPWLSAEARAGLIGAGIGVVAWFAPELVGGGDGIAQRMLTGHEISAAVACAFVIRFALGPISYAAATPGGLFAPLLALGAQFGLLCGAAYRLVFPSLAMALEAFVLVGMAALFAGVVRSPITGIVLVAEMTGNATMLLPMAVACFMAMVVPTWLRDPPIYDSLRERTLRLEEKIRSKSR